MTPYTINDLPALASLTANDYIPVWDSEASGEPTYKIKVSDMIASMVLIASLLKQDDVVNDLTTPATTTTGKVLDARLGSKVSASRDTVLNETNVTSDTFILSLAPGYYKVVFGVDTTYLPDKYGVLIVAKSDDNYTGFVFTDTHGNCHYRVGRNDNSTWYYDWQTCATAIKRVVVNKTVTMSAMGEIKFCNYSDVASDCAYNKVIGITPQNIQTGANTVIDVLAYSDGIYIDSVAAFTSKTISLLVSYATSELPTTIKDL